MNQRPLILLLLSSFLLVQCSDEPQNTHSEKALEIPKGNSLDKKVSKSTPENNAKGENYNDEDYLTKATVSLSTGDSTIDLVANIRKDHRIFGYAKPDTNSERLLVLSVFTDDVENNRHKCRLGAYYQTSGMEDLRLKYILRTKDFIKAEAIDKSGGITPLYFEAKWIEFE